MLELLYLCILPSWCRCLRK